MDVLLRRMDFFKVRAVVEKFSVLYLFHHFLSKCQEIRFKKTQSFPFLAGYDKLILIFSSLITSLHSYWQTGSVCGGSLLWWPFPQRGQGAPGVMKLQVGQAGYREI